jgi:DNA-directed RNA polymerase subunit RPC12/RpoP
MLRFQYASGYLLAYREASKKVAVWSLKVCRHCGGTLTRVHRTLAEKLNQSQVFKCRHCGERQSIGGLLLIDRGKYASCPSCGSYRVSVRQTPDKIDKMYSSPSSIFKRIFGGTLYRCRYCRIQFYDLRPLRNQPEENPDSVSSETGEQQV